LRLDVGLSSSWLAVRGKSSQAALQELALAPTGERDELPAESPIAGVALPGGWYVVILDHGFFEEPTIRDLSIGCEVVAGFVEEHVMYSRAEQWRDGALIWRVVHDAQEGIRHLELEGALPADSDAVRKRLVDEQEAAGGEAAGVDYMFDAPPDIARLVTGFSYDLEPEDGFAVLKRSR
jgi:hypothetical protein